MHKVTQLSNKLRIVSKSLPDREGVAIGLWVGVGGRHESSPIKGAAHFLEHIVFRGTEKFTCDQIKEEIEGVGGSLNAFTCQEQTCYYAKVPVRYLDHTFDILSDMAFFPNIKKKDVERERSIILEEIKMYHDLPQYHVMDLLDELMWPNHPLGENIAGDEKSVSGLAVRDLNAFHKRYYSPENVVISACGKVDHDSLVKTVEKKLKSLKSQKPAACLPVDFVPYHSKANFDKKNVEQMHLALGFHGYPYGHENIYPLALLSTILGGNMSSRLFDQVREKKGLAYSISSSMKALSDTGSFLIRAGVDNKKIIDAIGLIIKVLEKTKRDGVSDAEFKRAQEYFLGQFLLGLEDSMDHMLWMGESLMTRNRVRTIEETVEKVKQVTSRDVKRVMKEMLGDGRINLALVGPVTEDQKVEIRQILGIQSLSKVLV